MTKLSSAEIKEKLVTIEGWSLQSEKLHREFKFKDFIQAFLFMTKVAEIAEKMNHHPEWLNVYNCVTVDLTTHDASGITSKDFELALKMNQAAKVL